MPGSWWRSKERKHQFAGRARPTSRLGADLSSGRGPPCKVRSRPRGRPVSGRVLALEHGTRTARSLRRLPWTPHYRIECPRTVASSRSRGLRAEPGSLLLHVDSLYRDLFWSIRRGKLTIRFSREIERRLQDVRLDFKMEKAAAEPRFEATSSSRSAGARRRASSVPPEGRGDPRHRQDGGRARSSRCKSTCASPITTRAPRHGDSQPRRRTWPAALRPAELDWVREPAGHGRRGRCDAALAREARVTLAIARSATEARRAAR